MAGKWLDLIGTVLGKIQLGIAGPFLKNESGAVAARNAADAAYVAMRAVLFQTYGNDFELNAGAAGSGDDWKFTLTRPSSGMTHDLQVIFPAGDPTTGQALTVASFAGDVITLEWTTIAGGSDKVVVDTTSLAFGDTSPVDMFTRPANAIVLSVTVVVDTPFDGTPSLSIGITGQTSKYMPTTAVDLTAAAATTFEYTPGLPSVGSTEAMIATYSQGSASVGAARILVAYVIPG